MSLPPNSTLISSAILAGSPFYQPQNPILLLYNAFQWAGHWTPLKSAPSCEALGPHGFLGSPESTPPVTFGSV